MSPGESLAWQWVPEVDNHFAPRSPRCSVDETLRLCAEADLDVAVVFFERGPDRVE
jgi:hypothetical protein